MKSTSIAALLTLSIALGACGTKTDPTELTSVLEGTWMVTVSGQTCNYVGGTGAPAAYEKVTLVYAGGNYSYTQTYSSDSACSVNVLSSTESGTFLIGAATNVTGANSATVSGSAIAYTQSSNTVTPANGEDATLNGASECGLTSFKDGTTTSVAGLTCSGAVVTANGATVNNVYVLTSGSPATLQFGASAGTDNLGSATAPTALDTNTTFTKQ